MYIYIYSYIYICNIIVDSIKRRWDPLQRYSVLSCGCTKVRFHDATKLCLHTPTARCVLNSFLQSNSEKDESAYWKDRQRRHLERIDRFILSSHFPRHFPSFKARKIWLTFLS